MLHTIYLFAFFSPQLLSLEVQKGKDHFFSPLHFIQQFLDMLSDIICYSYFIRSYSFYYILLYRLLLYYILFL